ncbi:hypothetical protein J2S74_003527 [Evansella vedderi]|uniref:Cytochrome c oxidase subunit 2A n=1 Tax=Evansella vedderi TaxID=38282 RepID=A0ABT9ZY11_9BACI|nr:cytochrome c oxidase subunit 2A [Evansella vedderi]MDQ0256128.1 hypothetical protein [Evansella vedderi]
MSKSNLKTKQSNVSTKEDNSELRGTLTFVMFIGSFIFISWFAIFFLYLGRL